MPQEAIGDFGFKRLEKSTPANCVIASLESAFHAPATTEERKLRERIAEEKDRKLGPYKHLVQTSEGALALYRANLILETRSITSFFKQFASKNTPLGRALRRYNMTQQVIAGSELDQVIMPGKITLIAQANLKDQWHMIYAKRMSDRTITSGNDKNIKVTLRDDEKYLVYVFTRKE